MGPETQSEQIPHRGIWRENCSLSSYVFSVQKHLGRDEREVTKKKDISVDGKRELDIVVWRVLTLSRTGKARRYGTAGDD